MRKEAILMAIVAWGGLAPARYALAADPPHFIVVPGIQDTGDTDLVNALWVGGLGCPTAARLAPSGTFTDPACATGDNTDVDHQGLLLMKTGPTGNNALSGATIAGVQGVKLTELGYDIRAGSVCDDVAPRFDIFTIAGKLYKLTCNSTITALQPTAKTPGTGWTRLRWKPVGGVTAVNTTTNKVETISDPILSILIVFDEGQDEAPHSGLVVLDNIDVNGGLVGKN